MSRGFLERGDLAFPFGYAVGDDPPIPLRLRRRVGDRFPVLEMLVEFLLKAHQFLIEAFGGARPQGLVSGPHEVRFRGQAQRQFDGRGVDSASRAVRTTLMILSLISEVYWRPASVKEAASASISAKPILARRFGTIVLK